MSDIEKQWSCISEIIDRLDEQAKRLDWDRLSDEVSSVFSAAESITDGAEMFFSPYQYLYRLLHRVKNFDEKQEFNKVYETGFIENHEQNKYIAIQNYDYATFRWARQNGFTARIDNNTIYVEENRLTDQQLKHFLDKSKK